MATKRTAQSAGDPLIDIAGRMGELTGHNQAMLTELSRLNDQLVRLEGEQDKKHAENVALINKKYEDQVSLLNAHKSEDNANFAKVFKWFNYISGACGVVMILWAVFKLILPYIAPIKLGE